LKYDFRSLKRTPTESPEWGMQGADSHCALAAHECFALLKMPPECGLLAWSIRNEP